MNDTTTGPGNPHAPYEAQAPYQPPGYTPPPPHRDLDRLRRSTSDQYVAGVAGGLGRHFGIDPTIIRVLFVVLTFFGGAGVLVYAVCWLFVPEDGAAHAPIHVGSEPRKLLLIAAVGVGFLLAMGDAFSGFNAGWPIATIAVIIALVLIARDRKGDRARADLPSTPYAPPPGTPSAEATAGGPTYPAPAETTVAGFTDPATSGPVPPAPPAPPAPPVWMPPQPPVLPPHPKRTGVVWFWPTLALIAIGLGILGIVDANHDFDAAAYPALALAITGVMLVVGSFVGRPGGLVLVGLASSVTLAVATVVGGFHFGGADLEDTPQTAAEVQSSYEITNGRILLDLSQVSDPLALAGRKIELSAKAAEIRVIVPRELNLHIDAELGFAGGIRVPGYDGGGIQDDIERNVVGKPVTTTAALELELDATVGQITVEQR